MCFCQVPCRACLRLTSLLLIAAEDDVHDHISHSVLAVKCLFTAPFCLSSAQLTTLYVTAHGVSGGVSPPAGQSAEVVSHC